MILFFTLPNCEKTNCGPKSIKNVSVSHTVDMFFHFHEHSYYFESNHVHCPAVNTTSP